MPSQEDSSRALPSEQEEAPLFNSERGKQPQQPQQPHVRRRKLVATLLLSMSLAASLLVASLAMAHFAPNTASADTAEVTVLADSGDGPDRAGAGEEAEDDGGSQDTVSEFITSAEGTKTFPWGPPERTVFSSLYDAYGKEGVEGAEAMAFTESKTPKRKWNEIAQWVKDELLEGPDPFKAHGGKVPVPWPANNDGQDQLGHGQYVGYTRRQLCFIVAKSLIGAKTQGYNNGLQRYMETQGSLPPDCVPRENDFGKAWWKLLAACSADPGLKDGGQGPMLLAAKAVAKPDVSEVRNLGKKAQLSSAGLRVCPYDDGTDGLPAELKPVPTAGCAQPKADGPGRDFMTGGLAKQATQDISARFLGGYIYGNACGLGGGQDERLMVYLPEVSALTFFLSEAPGTANTQNPPQLRQPSWILGARKMFYGLDGTARFNHYEGFDENVPLTSDLVTFKLGGKTFQISGSRPFVGFMSENQDFVPWADANGQRLARRNKEPRQRVVDPGSPYTFGKQVRAWYRSVALTSYHEDMQPLLRSLVGSIGVGPWLAGLWWGDSQLGLLAVWLGHALAAKTWGDEALGLDYYLYSSFTENPGNQCFVHSKARCQACLGHCHAKPLPSTSYWLPQGVATSGGDPCVPGDANQDCGSKGIEDVVKAYSGKTVSELWGDVESKLGQNPQDVSRSVFDILLR